jgi:hypothetical protein
VAGLICGVELLDQMVKPVTNAATDTAISMMRPADRRDGAALLLPRREGCHLSDRGWLDAMQRWATVRGSWAQGR